MDRITIATSSGLVWLTVVTHFVLGLIALAAGAVALKVAKGGRAHKKSGIVFSAAMIGTGLLAAAIYAFSGRSVLGGLFVVYLVFTAVTTVRTLPLSGRLLDIVLMLFAFTFGAVSYVHGVEAWKQPRHMMNGVPAGMIFFLGTISLLAAIGDLRMIRAGGIGGPRRLARHLWRMCFALFIATGSFFLGQAKFIPEPVRITPLLFGLAVAPLGILLYWMWRVRLRRRLSGIIVATQQ